MALLEALKKRRAGVDTAAVDAKAKRWEEYREILERNERPRTKDADRLVDLVAELGIGDDRQVEMHVAVIQEHARLRADAEAGAKVAGRIERAEAAIEAARTEYTPHRKRFVETVGKHEKTIAEARDAGELAQEVREKLEVLNSQFAELLTGKPAPPGSDSFRQRRVSDGLHATAQRLGIFHP